MLDNLVEGLEGKAWREQVADLIGQVLPITELVPDVYAHWRTLVNDAMRLMLMELSTPRLVSKIAAQQELPADASTATRLAVLISKMPGLQKLGQVVARNQHLDPALKEQLAKLENEIRDSSPEEIVGIINERLGERAAKYGIELDSKILAEASVSAVVKFSWMNPATGQREAGVFKVLKPYVAEYFAEDIALLRHVAATLAFQSGRYGFDSRPAPETIAETCRLLEYEIDFGREQKSLEQAREAYCKQSDVIIPQVIQSLCSEGITAMSEVHGVKITDAFNGKPELRQKAARQALESIIAAPLFSEEESALFHADPHAGNLFYNEEESKLIVLDWALMERLSREQRRNIIMLTLMLMLRDAAGVASLVRQLSPEESDGKRTALIEERVAKFIDGMPRSHIPGSAEVMRLLDELAFAGIGFPAALLMFRKARFTLDGVLHDLTGGSCDLDASMFGYFIRRWKESPAAAFLPLWPDDWIPLQMSALNYPARLWTSMAIDAFRAYRLGLLPS